MRFFLAFEQLGEKRGQRVNGRLNGYSLCAVFLLGFFHFLSDSIQSFIPGDLDEFSRSALANALERNLKSLFAVCMLNLRDAFQTNCLITFVRPIIRLDQDQTPITNRAFEMAVTLTVTIMERISDPLPRLGVGLGWCEPSVGCDHVGRACEAERPRSSAGRL